MVDRRRDSIIRLPEVLRRTGLKRTTLYRKIRDRSFPTQVRLSLNCVGWYESDVDGWVADPS
ncbi:AlpA family phage regulatory protein [Sphingomonas histidinilytica]|uniref:helix-turn-helix transcriptional regulator n=1 Tax=Rhizorhabdus histidinilytica TaxID=439228 RepID=UPI001ADC6455|nr:AlpA family phage regulatory protein [Rhizorhabdus histidinilytica]MBO9377646.1 AlpA family phage regulatory protein [Rhizorhabdus histidinilytica]